MGTDVEVLLRISSLERRVEALMKHLDLPEPADDVGLSQAALDAIKEGNSTKAVKLIRSEKQCDLAEAQRIFDSMLV
jgi:hypothetical protein